MATATTPRERLSDVLGSLWWIPLVRGIAFIVLGAYALFDPGMTAAVLVQLVGILLVVEAALAIVAGILGHTPSRLWTLARAVLLILVGLFVLSYPGLIAGLTAMVVLYFVAAGLIVAGLFEIMAAIRDRKEIEGEGWLTLIGALTVLFGILVLIAPIAFGLLIVRILGAFAIFHGVALIVLAFRLRTFGNSLKA